MNLGDYVDVPTRFRLALDKWPDLRVVETPAEVVTIGDRTFISVTVKVYRDLLDLLPCVATAWEPFPGTTPYVRNSEMMNCSTSALGRCLGMMIPFGKMASFEEVQNRQDEQPAAAPSRQPKIIVDMPNKEVWPVSKKQLQELSELGYGGAVPANWNEAKAIIARMQVK
tara:strand:- start:947 stop:1453 length:507 start_codon:yes stop_codon:yes gene_type:complete